MYQWNPTNGKEARVFYDYVSPYSYLADSQVSKVAGSNLVYRPMFLGAVMQATGNKPPGSIDVKGKYLRKDIARWALRYGVRYKRNPKFPQSTLKALRLAVMAQQDGVFDKVHSALFAAMFAHESDLDDDKVLADIMNAAGLDETTTFARIADQSIKDRLKENTKEAIETGAFGAPTFFVGNEIFFGNDRFDFIKEALK